MKHGKSQLLLRLPEWLIHSVRQNAQNNGRTTTGEIREQLIRAYGHDDRPEKIRGTDRRKGEP